LFTLTPADVRSAMDGQGFEALVRLRDGGVPRLGFTTGVLMQFVNGKEWALVLTVMRLALEGFGGGLLGIASIAAVTTSGGLIAMSLWTLGGGRLAGVLRRDMAGRRVFVGLGLLVVLLLLALGLRGP